MVDKLISVAVDALADALGSSAADAASSAVVETVGNVVFDAVCNQVAEDASRIAVEVVDISVDALTQGTDASGKSIPAVCKDKIRQTAENQDSSADSPSD